MFTVKRIAIAAGILFVVFIGLLIAGYLGISSLARRLADENMPGLSFAEMEVGWNRIQLSEVKYTSPVTRKETLSADVIKISPSYLSFLSDTVRVGSLQIDSPYIYLERDRSGRLILPFPESLEGAAEEGTESGNPGFQALFQNVEVTGGRGEFLDRSVGEPFAHYKFSELYLIVDNLRYPVGDQKVDLELSLQLEGQQPGKLNLEGWVQPGQTSSDLAVEVNRLHLPELEPYLRGVAALRGIRSGTVDSRSTLEMERRHYIAEGEMSLLDLDFGGSGGSLLGVPSQLVTDFLKSQGNSLVIPFQIEGDLDGQSDPRAQLIEAIQAALVQTLGIGSLTDLQNLLKKGNVEDLNEGRQQLEEQKDKIRDLFNKP